MDSGFVVNYKLVRHRLPLIRLLYINSRPCSALFPDLASCCRTCSARD